MDTSDCIALGASALAFIALGVSLTTLWKTHIAPFVPIFSVGSCRFRVYPIKSEKDRWFLPSLDVSLSVANSGAKVGKIEDARIRVSFPDLPIPGHYEMFYAKWDVDSRKLSRNRFEWIAEAVTADWMPFVVLPRETEAKHIVFESRWDDPVVQDKMLCSLEVRDSRKPRWSKIAEWDYHLGAESWSELAEVGSSFSTSPDDSKIRKEFRNPRDLHKYTGSKQDIPKDGFRAGPSYLDFPVDEQDNDASEEIVEPKDSSDEE